MLRDGSERTDRSGHKVSTATPGGTAETSRAVDLADTTDGVGLLTLRCLNAAELDGLGRHGLLDVLGEIQRFVNQAAGYQAKVLGALNLLGSDGRAPEVCPHIALRDATGVSERDARRIARTAHKTGEHGAVLNSLSQGDITAAQAEVLCDARVTNEVRAELLAAAVLEDSDQTRQRVHEVECCNETAMQRFSRQREARGAGWRRDHEGMLKLWASFDPRSAAQIEAALETLRQQYWINDKQVRTNRRSPAQRDADVLAHAIAGLTYNETDEKAVERLTNRSRQGSAPHLPAAQVSVLIDLDALRQQTDAVGVTDAGIELPPEVVRALACDAHHIIHWADSGPTNLDNLVLVCHRHHHHLHEHNYQMIRQPNSTWHVNQKPHPIGVLDPEPEPCHTTKQARGP